MAQVEQEAAALAALRARLTEEETADGEDRILLSFLRARNFDIGKVRSTKRKKEREKAKGEEKRKKGVEKRGERGNSQI